MPEVVAGAVTGAVEAGVEVEVVADVGVAVYAVAVVEFEEDAEEDVEEDAEDVEVGCDVLGAAGDAEVKAAAVAAAVVVVVAVEAGLVLMPMVGKYPEAVVVEKYFAAHQKRNDHPMIGGNQLIQQTRSQHFEIHMEKVLG